MKIGIIAEGTDDQKVITNILHGAVGIDGGDVIYIRPDLSVDETTKSFMNEKTAGGWPNVRKDCRERDKLEKFFLIEGQEAIVIHLDSAEAEQYEVARPQKEKNNLEDYTIFVRNSIIEKVNEWLNDEYADNLIYAIAIEETEAWLLTIFEEKESTVHLNPKKKLEYLNEGGRIEAVANTHQIRRTKHLKGKRGKKQHQKSSDLDYKVLSIPFRDQRNLTECSAKNHSLRLFCESLSDLKDR